MATKDDPVSRGNNSRNDSAGSFREDFIQAMFVMISAGRDHERSAGVSTVPKDFSLPNSPAGTSGGVFTSALLQVMKEKDITNKNVTKVSWMQVMERLREIVREKGFTNQVPQLSSSTELNVNDPSYGIMMTALSYQDGKIVSQKTVSSDLDFDPSE